MGTLIKTKDKTETINIRNDSVHHYLSQRCNKDNNNRDVPSGPVVKTLLSLQEAWVLSLDWELRSHQIKDDAKYIYGKISMIMDCRLNRLILENMYIYIYNFSSISSLLSVFAMKNVLDFVKWLLCIEMIIYGFFLYSVTHTLVMQTEFQILSPPLLSPL